MTPVWNDAPAPVARLLKIVRFGLVGVVATATYLVIAVSLPAILGAAPAAAAIVASVASVLVSYVGHHQFTFARTGRHAFYLPRFLLLSAVLSAGASLGTYGLTDLAAIDYRLAAVLIAVAYATLSFVANNIGVFRDA